MALSNMTATLVNKMQQLLHHQINAVSFSKTKEQCHGRVQQVLIIIDTHSLFKDFTPFIKHISKAEILTFSSSSHAYSITGQKLYVCVLTRVAQIITTVCRHLYSCTHRPTDEL